MSRLDTLPSPAHDVECPWCTAKNRIDEDGTPEVGETFVCGDCEREFEVTSTDVEVWVWVKPYLRAPLPGSETTDDGGPTNDAKGKA